METMVVYDVAKAQKVEEEEEGPEYHIERLCLT